MMYEILSKPDIASRVLQSRIPLTFRGHVVAQGRRELLTQLSSALGRSQLVIILWDLNDREQDISLILSKALGLPIVEAGGDEGGFRLPRGAVAFIDTHSVVYGYYLESGSQSIVVLTHLQEVHDFAVRAFLLPYLEEKYPDGAADDRQSVPIPQDVPASQDAPDLQEIAQPEARIPQETETLQDASDLQESPIPAGREGFTPPALDTQSEPQPDSPAADTGIAPPPVTSPEPPAARPDEEPAAAPVTFDWEREAPEDSEQVSDDPVASKGHVPLALKIVTIVLAALLALIGGYLIYDKIFSGKLADRHYEKVRTLKSQTGSTELPAGALSDFAGLYDYNKRIAGWLSLDETGIDYPVLVPPESDGNYYKNHLTDGTYNKYGALYLPEDYEPMDYWPNTVIHGANFGDGRMLSDLERYLEPAFYSEHPAIQYDTLYHRNSWLVFAVLITEKQEDFNPGKIYFEDYDSEFLGFIEQIKRRSLIQSELDINENDVLLTLMTDYSQMDGVGLAIVARKLRFGESVSSVEAKVNPSAVLPEVWHLKNGSTTLPVTLQFALERARLALSDVSSEPESSPDSSEQEQSSESSSAVSEAAFLSDTITSLSVSSASGQTSSTEKSSSSLVSKHIVSSKSVSSSAPVSSSAVSSAVSSPASSSQSSSAPSAPPRTLTVKNQLNGGKQVTGSAESIIADVLEAEMGSGFHIEALKAQAVAAYTWILNQGGTPGVPMKTAGARAKEAAKAVLGQVVHYGGKRANVFYFAMSAGKTARSEEVWSTPYPYLISVDSGVDRQAANFQTIRTYSKEDMARWLASGWKDSGRKADVSGLPPEKWFQLTYDANGLYVKSVKIGNLTVKGSEIRMDLLRAENVGAANTLRSHAFQIVYDAASGRFQFTVKGYGHGVGMSQVGANYFAKNGMGYEAILKHYYPGTTLGWEP